MNMRMLRRGSVAAVMLVLAGAVFFVVRAQREADEVSAAWLSKQPYLRSKIDPDTSSKNWRQLSDDIGLMMYEDQLGNRRGTLYVKVTGDSWDPIALDGMSELMGPRALPAEQSH